MCRIGATYGHLLYAGKEICMRGLIPHTHVHTLLGTSCHVGYIEGGG